MKKLIIYIVCLAGIVLSGCASKKHTKKYVETGTESVNNISRAIIAAQYSELAGSPGPLDAYVKDFDSFVALQRSAFAKIEREIEEEKKQREAIVSALGSIVIGMVPGGSPVIEVVKALGVKIDKTGEDALAKANEKTEEVKATAEKNEGDIATLNVEMTKAKSNIDEMKTYYTTKTDVQNSIIALAKEVEQLGQKEQDALRARIAEMEEGNTEFYAEFQKNLLAEAKKKDWSEDDIKKIATMTPGEAFAAYGAGGAGGLVSLFALIRTLGPSRGKKELERIQEELKRQGEELKSERLKAAEAKQPPAG